MFVHVDKILFILARVRIIAIVAIFACVFHFRNILVSGFIIKSTKLSHDKATINLFDLEKRAYNFRHRDSMPTWIQFKDGIHSRVYK